METLKKLVVTPNGEQLLDLNNQEIVQYELYQQQAIADQQAKEEKIAIEQANKQSALNKLKALGLNDAEIKAIIGI